MKHTSLYVALFSIASIMTISSSCTNKSGGAVSDNADSTVVSDSSDIEGLSFDTIATETLFKADTTRFSSISLKMELPTATDGVEGFISSQLCHIVGGCISYINCYEGDSRFPLFEGMMPRATIARERNTISATLRLQTNSVMNISTLSQHGPMTTLL